MTGSHIYDVRIDYLSDGDHYQNQSLVQAQSLTNAVAAAHLALQEHAPGAEITCTRAT